MRKSRFTERQIVSILKDGQGGRPARRSGAEARHRPGDVLQQSMRMRIGNIGTPHSPVQLGITSGPMENRHA